MFAISFIHIEHLYSASSRKLLRSAPNTSMVKQSATTCAINSMLPIAQKCLIFCFQNIHSQKRQAPTALVLCPNCSLLKLFRMYTASRRHRPVEQRPSPPKCSILELSRSLLSAACLMFMFLGFYSQRP